MKSVKFKLFASFSLALLFILTVLSIISIHFFTLNQENEAISKVEKNIVFVKEALLNKKSNIDELYKKMDLNEQVLLVFKKNKLIFSNESKHDTKEILEHIKEKKLIFDKFVKNDDYFMTKTKIEDYRVFMGIDEDYIEDKNEAIINTIVTMNSIIFVFFLVFIYFIINRTIKPLKQILSQVQDLQINDDLSKRLEKVYSNDEFELLSKTFNKMLDNIQKSVENIKQFSSDASHELRTPLTVIQGEIEVLDKQKASKEELLEVIQKINKEQKKLQNIIKDFLLLSRLDKEQISKQSSYLDKVVFDCIEDNLLKIEQKKLQLKLDIKEDVEVFFSEKYLKIVINNLLSNAIKYTNEGYIFISIKTYKNKKTLSICDSGVGLDKNECSKIFERFYRADKARTNFNDGVGLGLSIVKRVCEKFNAKVYVKSEKNKGSCFSIEF